MFCVSSLQGEDIFRFGLYTEHICNELNIVSANRLSVVVIIVHHSCVSVAIHTCSLVTVTIHFVMSSVKLASSPLIVSQSVFLFSYFLWVYGIDFFISKFASEVMLDSRFSRGFLC